MKTTLLRILTFSLLTLSATVASAQGYKTGVGLRLSGWNSGITLKQSVGGNSAIEGIVALQYNSIILTALYEKHTPFPSAEGLTWFFGGGAHVGFYNDGYDYYYFNYRGNKVYVDKDNGSSSTGFGADFIIGLAYKFKKAPVELSVDAKPFVDFVDGINSNWDGALSVRFTL